MTQDTPETEAANEITAILDRYNVGLMGVIVSDKRTIALRCPYPAAMRGAAQLGQDGIFNLDDAAAAIRHATRAGAALMTISKELAEQYVIMRKLVEKAGYRCSVDMDAGPEAFIKFEPKERG